MAKIVTMVERAVVALLSNSKRKYQKARERVLTSEGWHFNKDLARKLNVRSVDVCGIRRRLLSEGYIEERESCRRFLCR